MKNIYETKLAKKRRGALFANAIKSNWKTILLFALVTFVAISPMFAADGTIETLDSFGEKIVELLNAKWVKAILLVALAGEAIGVVVAGQQGGGGAVIKRFAPWIVGTVILLCAGPITQFFFQGYEIKIE